MCDNRVMQNQELTEEEETWLDTEGNLVDEVKLIDELEKASDYEGEIESLDATKRAIIARLREQAGVKTVGNKHKNSGPANMINLQKCAARVEKPPVFTRKENATVAQRIEILDWYHANGKVQKKTAAHFDSKYPNLCLTQPLISKWVKKEVYWREQFTKSGGALNSAKRARQTQHPEVTEMLNLWVTKIMENGVSITGEVLRQKWQHFANLVGVPEDERLTLSEGWVEKYKKRNGLHSVKRHGEAASADSEAVANERARIQKLLKEMPPDRGLADQKHSGIKGSKVRLTYALTANADGSEKRRAFIIGKAKRPRAFQKKSGEQLGFHYRNNAKAWMTTVTRSAWNHNYHNPKPKLNPKTCLGARAQLLRRSTTV
ncbi:hypothetical protein D9757_007081 [Collybiopsis confluens]|uniref:HTH CENPB-type domain-containing protein n=1 Tax=Collybiopsis confluens TaxID=2823264 RepID=A0A8H5HCY4_9AGAR|nr:hypothetical protein D9757_007081 [Collybiopsis confluens]